MPRTAVLILGAIIFIIGNLMSLSWLLGLWFDNFTLDILGDRIYSFFYCANYPYLSSPCLINDFNRFAIITLGVPAIWLTGLGLMIYGLIGKVKVKASQL